MPSPDNCSITILIERVDGSWFASATGCAGNFCLFAGPTPHAALQELLACARNVQMQYPGNPLLQDLAEMAGETAWKED